MFATVELLDELGEGGKGKEKDRASAILKYITPVQVEDTRMHTESC
jgi:hypothetical protein